MIISRLDAVLILTGFTLAVFSLSAGAVPAPARNLVLRSSDGPTPFRFLHLTDLHIDPDYKENSSTYSQCHRVPSQWRKGLAQHYGMVGTDCDAPMALAKESLDFVRVNWGREAPQEQKASFVVWTGDSARHDRDPSSPMTNKLVLDHNQISVDLMRDTFDSDVVIVPNIGNHDVHPANHMAQPPPLAVMLDNSTDVRKKQHFLTFLLHVWSPILFSHRFPWEHANITRDFLQFGSFVKTAIPGPNGLAVVSINTLWFFPSNDGGAKCKFQKHWDEFMEDFKKDGLSTDIPPWDIFQDEESGKWNLNVPRAAGQPASASKRVKKLTISSAAMLWLHNVLLKARKTGTSLMLMGHIPPQGNYGALWYESCTEWFVNMIGEFLKDGTVLGFWGGHTNEDGLTFIARNKEYLAAAKPASTSRIETDDDDLDMPDDVIDPATIGAHRHERYRDFDPTLTSTYRAIALSAESAAELLKPSVEFAGVLFTSPSLVPARNPSFRVAELLRNSHWRIAGWTQWAIDLHEDNKRGALHYGIEYDTRVEYGLGTAVVGTDVALVEQGGKGQRTVKQPDEPEDGISPNSWKTFVSHYSKNTKGVRELYERFKDVEGDIRF